MLNQLGITQNERGEQVGFAILVMVLYELFEVAAHVLRAHIRRVRYHGGIFAGKILRLVKYRLRSFT